METLLKLMIWGKKTHFNGNTHIVSQLLQLQTETQIRNDNSFHVWHLGTAAESGGSSGLGLETATRLAEV